MKRLLTIIVLIAVSQCAAAQFPPQAGIIGTTAISATSGLFKAWAAHYSIGRGLQQIGNGNSGYTTIGDSTSALGAPDGNVVSLGDSGVAVLTFTQPIVNGPGADFAVFENGFLNPQNSEEAFLELAFVEVSSDGVHYIRFPATSLTADTFQVSSTAGSTYQNARLLNNLAGKYIANYGTPFDLAELADSTNLDINHITHIRIVDCIGDVGMHASYDAAGHKINDPYPTPFPSGGFDLDAVGVLHQSNTGIEDVAQATLQIFHNPAVDAVQIVLPCEDAYYSIADLCGRVQSTGVISRSRPALPVGQLSTGCYIFRITNKNGGQSWTGKLYRQ